MSSRRAIIIVGSVGTGCLIGGGLVWLLWGRRFRSDVRVLMQQIEALRRDLEQVQALIRQVSASSEINRTSSSTAPPRNSAKLNGRVDTLDGGSDPTSSAEDDEIFEEAYDGPVPWLNEINCNFFLSENINGSVNKTGETERDRFYADIDRLLEGSDADKREAVNQLKNRENELNKDVNFLWRLAKSTFYVARLEGSSNAEKQKELTYKAKDYADKALAADNASSNAHKWYAITLGSIGDYEPIKNKISNGYAFRTHIEKAIELNPKDYGAHHLLGRWCFGVYMLSWMERKMASTLFAEPPSASIEETLEHFLEADRLNPGKWRENCLFIAKSYIQMKDYRNAVTWLDKANNLPIKGQEDENAQVEVTAFLKQYSSYR